MDHLNAIRKSSRGWSQAIFPSPSLLPPQVSLKNVIWGTKRFRLHLASRLAEKGQIRR